MAVAAMTVAVPAMAQDGTDAGQTGFNGIYVGAAGGYDVQGNDGGSILFDRNLDGRFGDTVLTGTGGNAFAPGFCNGRGVSANAPGRTSAGNPAAPAGAGCRNDEDGWAYYGRVGIDQQMGRIVVGVVGEFGKTEINDQVTGFSSTPANYVMYRSISWEAGIRARAGFTPNDQTLFYGTFGPGYARIDRDFTSSQSTNSFTQSGKKNQFGIQGGGGVEQKIGNNFSVGLEYLYHQYQDNDFRVRAAGPAGTPFTNAGNGGTVQGTDFRRSDDKFRWHSIRATAAFRF
ncbi:hypothetical protein ASG29_13795 [Sphingomonas sp. Leaf412]|nr:hypothetical protein ASG29_13795 [Sphingomonas sp. Leaf412]